MLINISFDYSPEWKFEQFWLEIDSIVNLIAFKTILFVIVILNKGQKNQFLFGKRKINIII